MNMVDSRDGYSYNYEPLMVMLLEYTTSQKCRTFATLENLKGKFCENIQKSQNFYISLQLLANT